MDVSVKPSALMIFLHNKIQSMTHDEIPAIAVPHLPGIATLKFVERVLTKLPNN